MTSNSMKHIVSNVASPLMARLSFVFLLCVAAPSYAQTSRPAKREAPKARTGPTLDKKACVGLYRQKAFLQAGNCFAALGRSMGPPHKLSTAQKYTKGQFLRNAAVALDKAAESKILQKNVKHHIRERAIKLLKQYQKERLCESDSRCREALDLEFQIKRRVKYTTVTIIASEPEAILQLQGYKFIRKHTGDWSLEVRPGRYVVTNTPPKKQKPTSKIIFVTAGKTAIVSFRIQRNIGAILCFSGSALAVVAGGILIGVGVSQWFLAESVWLNPDTHQDEEGRLIKQRANSQVFNWVGGALLGVGLTLAIIGSNIKPKPPRKSLGDPLGALPPPAPSHRALAQEQIP